VYCDSTSKNLTLNYVLRNCTNRLILISLYSAVAADQGREL